MSTRISDAVAAVTARVHPVPGAAFLLLAACGDPAGQTADTRVLAQVEAQQRAAAEDDGHILCARGEAPLARACTVERTSDRDGLILTLRHPDGGFRRLRVTQDGRGVGAADGAGRAVVAVVGGQGIEGALDGDRYRLPATIGGRHS